MRYITTFIILMANWVIWSGMFDIFHLALGVISCMIVAFLSHDILFAGKEISFSHLVTAYRFIKYLPWLLYQIFLSNMHVAFLVLNPNMPIEPHMIKFKTRLKKSISLTTFANSIILTPGTITADITDGEVLVHCISKKVADDLLTGEMEDRVAHIFMED